MYFQETLPIRLNIFLLIVFVVKALKSDVLC